MYHPDYVPSGGPVRIRSERAGGLRYPGSGGVTERTKVAVLKTAGGQPPVGSNPTPSASAPRRRRDHGGGVGFSPSPSALARLVTHRVQTPSACAGVQPSMDLDAERLNGIDERTCVADRLTGAVEGCDVTVTGCVDETAPNRSISPTATRSDRSRIGMARFAGVVPARRVSFSTRPRAGRKEPLVVEPVVDGRCTKKRRVARLRGTRTFRLSLSAASARVTSPASECSRSRGPAGHRRR
jgi:hypothetical protein